MTAKRLRKRNMTSHKAYMHAWRETNVEQVRDLKRAQYARNKEATKARSRAHRLRGYGLSVADYDCLVSEQHGLCEICKVKPIESLAVDHCHSTGAFRGLLCGGCNRGLGQFKDDLRLLVSAARYLQEFSKKQLHELIG